MAESFPIFSRTARGYWCVNSSLNTAVAQHRRIAGDRRRKPELWTLADGAWLYVGPRGRRRTSRHVAQIFTAQGAVTLGLAIPDTIARVLEG